MSENLIVALISAGATIIAALIGKGVFTKLRERESSRYRRLHNLVDPRGRWVCKWYNEDGSLYVSDVVEIERWGKDGCFRGRGIQPDLTYTLQGEVDITRAMTVTYHTEDFPQRAYVGVAFLTFGEMDPRKARGRWFGRTRTGDVGGGRTEWRRESAN
jgi:hypothetical protein